MLRLVTLFVLTLALSLPGVLAHAANIDAAGAARLKNIVVQYLDDQKAAIQSQNRELRAQGDVLVEQAGSYYAITTPHLGLVEKDGSYTDIGILAINALPGDRDGEWKMTIAIPSPIIGYDQDKKADLRIDIGGQSFTGLWTEKFNNFTRLDARYENIKAVAQGEGITATIPSASILYNLTPSADGATWSGPIRYMMNNITVQKDGDPGISKIGTVDLTMNIMDYNPGALQKHQAMLDKATYPVLPGQFFDLVANAWDGFDSTLTVKDIDLSRPAIPGSPPGKLAMKEIVLRFAANGFHRDSVTLNLRTQYDGLNLIPAPAGFDEATPAQLNLDIHLDKLPFKQLLQLGREGIETANTQQDGGKIAGLQAAQMIPQILTKAGTNLKINKSYLGNTLYNIDLDGILNADLNAMMGAEGKAKLDIAGLDSLLNAIKTQMNDPALDETIRTRLNSALVSLTVLQMVGQQGKNAAGIPVRSYNLELTNDGKLMINGADLSMLKALAGAKN